MVKEGKDRMSDMLYYSHAIIKKQDKRLVFEIL